MPLPPFLFDPLMPYNPGDIFVCAWHRETVEVTNEKGERSEEISFGSMRFLAEMWNIYTVIRSFVPPANDT